MTTTRPTFTLSEAAKLTGVSRSTIRRYREAGHFPDAFQDSDRQWMIPIENLLAKGLKPVGELSKTVTLTTPAHEQGEASSETAPALLKRLSDAENELAVERAKREGVEHVLEEVRRRADLAERALLIIESPKPKVKDQDHSPIPMPSVEDGAEGGYTASPAGSAPAMREYSNRNPTPPTADNRPHGPAQVGVRKKAWWKW